MRERVQRSGRSAMTSVLAVAAIAGVAAGCSANSTRLSGGPLFAGSAAGANQAGAIESRDLQPLNATPSALGGATITTSTSLAERGWSVEGAPIVEVGPADTAATLSQGFGVPVSVILEANNLARAEDIRPGQRLVIPRYVYRDPAGTGVAAAAGGLSTTGAAPSTIAAAPTAGPGAPPTTLDAQAAERRHTVSAGETLFSVARTYGVPQQEVARLNGLPADGTIQLGQTLRIPAAGTDTGQPKETRVAALPPQADPAVTMTDASPAAGVPDAAAGSAPPATPAAAATAPDAGGLPGTFRWPVRGRIIAGFGKQADGARNDGINLAVPAGTPVHAAEAGTVIYAGNGLEGYGNLVLVKHADDWVSAYAHNETLAVSRGETVTRGQLIANVGKSGSVDQPQLHFELRKKSKPVDPLPHLTGA